MVYEDFEAGWNKFFLTVWFRSSGLHSIAEFMEEIKFLVTSDYEFEFRNGTVIMTFLRTNRNLMQVSEPNIFQGIFEVQVESFRLRARWKKLVLFFFPGKVSFKIEEVQNY